MKSWPVHLFFYYFGHYSDNFWTVTGASLWIYGDVTGASFIFWGVWPPCFNFRLTQRPLPLLDATVPIIFSQSSILLLPRSGRPEAGQPKAAIGEADTGGLPPALARVLGGCESENVIRFRLEHGVAQRARAAARAERSVAWNGGGSLRACRGFTYLLAILITIWIISKLFFANNFMIILKNSITHERLRARCELAVIFPKGI